MNKYILDIDRSGSISNEDLQKFLDEVEKLGPIECYEQPQWLSVSDKEHSIMFHDELIAVDSKHLEVIKQLTKSDIMKAYAEENGLPIIDIKLSSPDELLSSEEMYRVISHGPCEITPVTQFTGTDTLMVDPAQFDLKFSMKGELEFITYVDDLKQKMMAALGVSPKDLSQQEIDVILTPQIGYSMPIQFTVTTTRGKKECKCDIKALMSYGHNKDCPDHDLYSRSKK